MEAGIIIGIIVFIVVGFMFALSANKKGDYVRGPEKPENTVGEIKEDPLNTTKEIKVVSHDIKEYLHLPTEMTASSVLMIVSVVTLVAGIISFMAILGTSGEDGVYSAFSILFTSIVVFSIGFAISHITKEVSRMRALQQSDFERRTQIKINWKK